MNIVCVICSDLLIPSDDVFYTPCGHIFHFTCLTQWLERSKTCPQCREKTTSYKIHRLYFNFSNCDSIVEDTCSLQDKVDKLNFQLMVKDRDIKQYTEKSETLGKENKLLRKEVRKVESELSEKNSAIYALKEQIKYFKEQHEETGSKNKEIEQLRKKLEIYKNIQTLLEASTEDVDEMILQTCDPNTLITYISVMKREMTISLNKRRELRTKLKSLQQELTKVSMERNFLLDEQTKRKKFEEYLMECESEKITLQSKVKELEKAILQMKVSMKSDLKAIRTSNNNANSMPVEDIHDRVLNISGNEKQNSDRKEEAQNALTDSKSDSPYLPVKSSGIFVLKQDSSLKRNGMKISGSILMKKPRIEHSSIKSASTENNAITYNGFGGHSKHDPFPISSGVRVKRKNDDIGKNKRQKLDVDSNQKIANFVL